MLELARLRAALHRAGPHACVRPRHASKQLGCVRPPLNKLTIGMIKGKKQTAPCSALKASDSTDGASDTLHT
eukprot:3684830-Pyramimonas_sp.AAC.1